MSFAFNFRIDDEENSGAIATPRRQGNSHPAIGVALPPVPQSEPPPPPLEELSIDDAYPVFEDGVVATVEYLSSSQADRRVGYYCPEEVRLWARANCLAPYLLAGEQPEGDTETSDLVSGVYEGGFQLWECSLDLAQWLLGPEGACEMKPGLRVAELGCGGGLPGLCCLRCFRPESVTFQDFNSEVLRAWTMPNCQLSLDALSTEARPPPRAAFIAGTWQGLAAAESTCAAFDLVLTSETIYNPAYYEQLHSALCHCLSPAGVALISAKVSYFGVGGSVSEFCEFLAGRGVFEYEVAFRTDAAALVRVILRLRRRAGDR